MKNIFTVFKIEIYKLLCQRYFIILVSGFILSIIGFGWVRIKVAGLSGLSLSGFQLAAFTASTGGSLLTLIMIILSGSAIASERSYGTLNLICLRPVPRGVLLWGKLFSLYSVSLFLLAVLLVSGLAAGMMFSGLEALSENDYVIYSFSELLRNYLTGFMFSLLPVFAWCSVAFFLSVVITGHIWANAISLVLFFAFYLLLPFDEIISFTPNQFFNAGMDMISKITYGLPAVWSPHYRYSFFAFLYVLFFSIASVIIFRKKDVLC